MVPRHGSTRDHFRTRFVACGLHVTYREFGETGGALRFTTSFLFYFFLFFLRQINRSLVDEIPDGSFPDSPNIQPIVINF
jgi:hypothetical protein